MIRIERISNPPRDSAVAMERTYDFIEFTGSSGSSLVLTDAQREKLLSSPIGKVAFGFLAVWKVMVTLAIGLGVIMALAGLGVLWFVVRDQPASNPWSASFVGVLLLLFLVGVIACGILMYVKLRRSKQDANFPSRDWTLRITQTWVECTENVMGVGRSNLCKPEEIQTISVAQDGALVAQLTGRSGGTDSQMILTGPLGPVDSAWLRDALWQLLGPGHQESSP